MEDLLTIPLFLALAAFPFGIIYLALAARESYTGSADDEILQIAVK